ncbi:MAG: flagellar hook-associated protein FlgL [Gammaproteobacteria bacterium]
MSMRLSSSQMYQQSVNIMLEQQAKLTEVDQQIASGKRILKPSDDPSATVQILNLNTEVLKLEQYSSNIDAARTQLSQTEEVLQQSGNVLQRARELMLQANNDTLDSNNRKAIAGELSSLKSQLVALANTRDATGEYVFAGFQVGTQPFSEEGKSVVYAGDRAQRMTQVGSGIQMAVRDNGHEVFRNIRTGNGQFVVRADGTNTGGAVVKPTQIGPFVADTYTVSFSLVSADTPMTYQVTDNAGAVVAAGDYFEGEFIDVGGARLHFDGMPTNGDTFTVEPSDVRDVFATIQDAVDVLEGFASGTTSTALLHNRLNEGLDNLDQSLSHLLDHRAGVGARMNSLDTQQDVHETNVIQLKESISSLEDLDYAEAVTELNLRLTALQAAQQAYIKIQNISLFQYL